MKEPGMTLIVKTVARVSVQFITVFGLYTIAYGHLSPGGGFAGGVIIAASFIMMMLAFGKEAVRQKFSERVPHVLASVGALLVLLWASIGLLSGKPFFFNFVEDKGQPFHLLSGGSIPLLNWAIGLVVWACLFGAFTALSVYRRSDSQ